MDTSTKIAVIGGGSWATANIKMLTDNRNPKEIFWWMRDEENIKHIKKYKHNGSYLSSIEIKVPSGNITSNQGDFACSLSVM